MTISWTGFAGGNLDAEVPVNMGSVFRQIVVIVLLPMLAGHFTQTWLIRKYGQKAYQTEWGPRFPPLSTLGVLGIAFVAIALQAETLLARPGELLRLIVPLLCLYGINSAPCAIDSTTWRRILK